MTNGYTTIAKVLHWLMALMILGLFGLGTYMHELPFSPLKLQLYSWHKWFGVTVFALVFARLAWRWRNPPPPSAPSISKTMQRFARAGHIALYVFMILVPLSGWLMSSAKGFQTVWFGVLPIPDLLERDRELGEVLQEVHEALNFALVATVAGHVLAALRHHFFLKDDTLQRMSFGSRRNP